MANFALFRSVSPKIVCFILFAPIDPYARAKYIGSECLGILCNWKRFSRIRVKIPNLIAFLLVHSLHSLYMNFNLRGPMTIQNSFSLIIILVTMGCSLEPSEKKKEKNPNPNPNSTFANAQQLGVGPGTLDPRFESNSQYIKATLSPLATTQHGEGQGRNAEIWYSSNIQSLFGQSGFGTVPEGTVAVKKFIAADNKIMVTGMVKRGSAWQYYMGPQNPFPTAPISSSEAQMCISCHQSTGAQNDLLPYLPRAQAASGFQNPSGTTGTNNPTLPFLPNGPGTMPANFKTNSQFVKVTKTALPLTQHEGGQGKNANIWYSSNIQAVFGRSTVQSVSTGTVAIKEFQTPDNKTMITGMVKTSSGWQYYMGPLSPFPTAPMLRLERWSITS